MALFRVSGGLLRPHRCERQTGACGTLTWAHLSQSHRYSHNDNTLYLNALYMMLLTSPSDILPSWVFILIMISPFKNTHKHSGVPLHCYYCYATKLKPFRPLPSRSPPPTCAFYTGSPVHDAGLSVYESNENRTRGICIIFPQQ